MLAQVANKVVGMDIDQDTIDFAELNYGDTENLVFRCRDGCDTGLEDESFSMVVGFETIEHILDYELYLQEMKRVMKENALFFISTPDRAIRKGGDIPHWHKQEWFYRQFTGLCERYFSQCDWFWQQWDGQINPGPSAKHDTFVVGILKK
jgi:SAM-dependent methyltransferase